VVADIVVALVMMIAVVEMVAMTTSKAS